MFFHLSGGVVISVGYKSIYFLFFQKKSISFEVNPNSS